MSRKQNYKVTDRNAVTSYLTKEEVEYLYKFLKITSAETSKFIKRAIFNEIDNILKDNAGIKEEMSE